jgi:hypothetical protein
LPEKIPQLLILPRVREGGKRKEGRRRGGRRKEEGKRRN